MHGNEPGIDPYIARRSSDVYQDLFEEEVFLIGKRIFMRWNIFSGNSAGRESLPGKYHPESHDLLEAAIYVPGWLVMLQLFENIPPLSR